MKCHSWHSTHESHWQHLGDQGLWWKQLFCLSLLLLILHYCAGFVALVLSQHGFHEWHPVLTCKAMPRTRTRTGTMKDTDKLSSFTHQPWTTSSINPQLLICWGLFLPFKTLPFSASLILAFCPSGHLQYTILLCFTWPWDHSLLELPPWVEIWPYLPWHYELDSEKF